LTSIVFFVHTMKVNENLNCLVILQNIFLSMQCFFGAGFKAEILFIIVMEFAVKKST